MTPSPAALAERLPDLPRWVEVRDLLRSGACEIFGTADDLSLVVRDPKCHEVFVVGSPAPGPIEEAVRDLQQGIVVAPTEMVSAVQGVLPRSKPVRDVIHILEGEVRCDTPSVEIRLLAREDLRSIDAPPDLLRELEANSERCAAFVEGRAVSFCYAGARSESFWDISIDTLPPYRRNGYAAACVSFMIRHMRPRIPVWAALDDNPASSALARKLGFLPVDELVVVAIRV